MSLPVNGIPSRDCLRRLLMAALKPEEPSRGAFRTALAHVIQTDNGGPNRLIAVDGKKRVEGRTTRQNNLASLQIVSPPGPARKGFALGQVATEGEIQRNHSNLPSY